jgi:hypothetical protein
MMCYRVYLWKEVTSTVPEVVQQVQAVNAPAALQAVMHAHHVPYADYAWVVPDNEDLPCYEGHQVRCPSARPAGQ